MGEINIHTSTQQTQQLGRRRVRGGKEKKEEGMGRER